MYHYKTGLSIVCKCNMLNKKVIRRLQPDHLVSRIPYPQDDHHRHDQVGYKETLHETGYRIIHIESFRQFRHMKIKTDQ